MKKKDVVALAQLLPTPSAIDDLLRDYVTMKEIVKHEKDYAVQGKEKFELPYDLRTMVSDIDMRIDKEAERLDDSKANARAAAKLVKD